MHENCKNVKLIIKMGFEGLLRKYKISKITDNHLSKIELEICEHLDKSLTNLTMKHLTARMLNGVILLFNSNNITIFEYHIKESQIYVRYSPCWEVLENYMCYEDIKVVMKDWIYDLYGFDIKSIDKINYTYNAPDFL